MKRHNFFIAIFIAAAICGCKSSTGPTPNPFTFTFHTMPPSRPGEVYALWAEVPADAAPSQILHGTFKSKMLSTFTVNDTGGVVGLDLSKVSSIIPDLRLIIDFELSVERPDSIGTEPAAIFLAAQSVTGSASNGYATLTQDDGNAFGGLGITSIASVATLASSAKTASAYKGEVYLMNATSPTNTSAGLTPDPLPFLPGSWHLGVWTIDSTSKPPVITFLGYVIAPDSKDSKSTKDNYHYPGGKSPSDTAISTLLDLTGGKSGVLLSLEPDVLPANPTSPFASWLLWGLVPAGEPAFQSFPLANIYKGTATVDVKFSR